ncbi:MAG TPA: methionine synthase [Candidatus Binatia bacterium]|nr:methionine synthase [Candidatus Binatia bacterium]
MSDIRADHVGSFLRPAEILETRHQGDDQSDHLHALEDRAILRVLERQRELGLDVLTDGEFRRNGFMGDLTAAVDGFDFGDGIPRAWKSGTTVAPSQPIRGIVNRKLVQKRRLTAHEVPFLKEHAHGAYKMTLPSATQFPAIAWKKATSSAAYPQPSDLLRDITAIIEREMAALAAEGVPYIQIDAPRYSYYLDPKWRAWLRAEMGGDPDALLDEALAADNACFKAARKPGVTLAIHLCRGNNRSKWYAEGGYDAIAEKMFNTLDVDRFLLEYEDERSGSFEPLRFVPKGKTVVLGLISSKLPQLEDKQQLMRRIEEASKYVPLANLALSPQCGFASVMEGNEMTEAEQWAKIALVVDTARSVWKT